MLLILLVGLLVLILVLITLVTWLFLRNEKSYQFSQNQSHQLMNQQQKFMMDLMNRIQSQDLPSYQTMTASTASSQTSTFKEPYLSQSDQAEYERMIAMAQSQGLGDTMSEPGFADDVSEFFDDINQTRD